MSNDQSNHGFSSAEGSSHPGTLGFLSRLTSEKKQTKDGQPPKRRGPKPDSKPAMTRRQELNRQAQRTHRERKELYIKALEQEVLRLKETYTHTTRERDAVYEENRRLRELLAAHGISYDFGASPIQFHLDATSYGPSSSGSISGSYTAPSESNISPPPMQSQKASTRTLSSDSPSDHEMSVSQAPQPSRGMAQLPNNRIDYDQVGIDFVLTLERPCMDHMQYLLVRSHNAENQPVHHPMENDDDLEHEHVSGHALMCTAPPNSHIMNKPGETYPFQMPPDLSSQSLAKLLDLSNRLPLDHQSEITPIMAWTVLYRHERLNEMTVQDIEQIKVELASKVRCYGFGAVLEEFELRDAIENVLSHHDSPQSAHLAGLQMTSRPLAAF